MLTFVPGKLSARMFSQLGVSWVGTANLNKASSHRVTSEIRKREKNDYVSRSDLLPCLSQGRKKKSKQQG